MLVTILNTTKEIYTALYVTLAVTAFCQALPEYVRTFKNDMQTLVLKIAPPPFGLD
jgi:hypothetical protein